MPWGMAMDTSNYLRTHSFQRSLHNGGILPGHANHPKLLALYYGAASGVHWPWHARLHSRSVFGMHTHPPYLLCWILFLLSMILSQYQLELSRRSAVDTTSRILSQNQWIEYVYCIDTVYNNYPEMDDPQTGVPPLNLAKRDVISLCRVSVVTQIRCRLSFGPDWLQPEGKEPVKMSSQTFWGSRNHHGLGLESSLMSWGRLSWIIMGSFCHGLDCH